LEKRASNDSGVIENTAFDDTSSAALFTTAVIPLILNGSVDNIWQKHCQRNSQFSVHVYLLFDHAARNQLVLPW